MAGDRKINDGFDGGEIVAIGVRNHTDDLPHLPVRQNGLSERILSRPPALGGRGVYDQHIASAVLGHEIPPCQQPHSQSMGDPGRSVSWNEVL